MKRAVAVGRSVYLRRASRRDAAEFVDATRRSRGLHGRWVQPATDEPSYRRWLVRGERDDIEQYLVVRRDDDSLAGFVNLNNIIRGNLRTAFLGYGAFVPHAGSGLMRAGLDLVLSTAFTQLGLHRLEANIQPENEASKGLVRGAGFRLEGYSPDYLRIEGVWRDHERWALTEPEWRRSAASAVTAFVNRYRPQGDIAFAATLGSFRNGPGDPTVRFAADGFWKAVRTVQGPLTIQIRPDGPEFEVRAWGDGAEEAPGLAARLLGALDTTPFSTDHPLVAELHRRHPGLRIGRSGEVFREVVVAICGQKVTAAEAKRAWRMLVGAYGDPAPGEADLALPPRADRLAGVAYHDLHVMGLEKRRADTIRRAASIAARLDALADVPIVDAHARLRAVAGIGVWTANEVAGVALGDPDAVSVGDFHLKNHVVCAFTGRPRGSDDEMLDLLEPFRGHRGRVVRLLGLGGLRAPRRGPRMAARHIGWH